MNPDFEADGIQLYCGDCLGILPNLSGIDTVITDPPYSANTHKQAKTNKGNGTGVKLIAFDSLLDDEFMTAVSAMILASFGWVVMTCDYRHAALTYSLNSFVRLGAWVKPNPMPQISADRPGQGFETVVVLHSGKSPKQWNRGGRKRRVDILPRNKRCSANSKTAFPHRGFCERLYAGKRNGVRSLHGQRHNWNRLHQNGP